MGIGYVKFGDGRPALPVFLVREEPQADGFTMLRNQGEGLHFQGMEIFIRRIESPGSAGGDCSLIGISLVIEQHDSVVVPGRGWQRRWAVMNIKESKIGFPGGTLFVAPIASIEPPAQP